MQNALESSSHSFHPATLQERHYYSPFLEGEPEVQKGEMNSLRFLSTSVAEGGSELRVLTPVQWHTVNSTGFRT